MLRVNNNLIIDRNAEIYKENSILVDRIANLDKLRMIKPVDKQKSLLIFDNLEFSKGLKRKRYAKKI